MSPIPPLPTRASMTKRSVGSNSGNTKEGGYAERAPRRQREGAVRNDAPRARASVKRLTSSMVPENEAGIEEDACESEACGLICAASDRSPSSSPAQDPALSRLLRGFESRWGRFLYCTRRL